MHRQRPTPVLTRAVPRVHETEFPVQEAASSVRRRDGVIPWVVVRPEELRSLPLDHREGFVLSLIDGSLTLEAILDMSGMSAVETLGVLRNLLVKGVIEVRDPDNDAEFCASSIVSSGAR